MNAKPVLPPHPPVHEPGAVPSEPGHVRILLSAASSQALLAVGSCFAIACRETSPGDGSRVVIHLIPCSFERGNDAVRCAMGEKPLARVKSTQPRAPKL